MHIFCDESGGSDPANDVFLVTAVVVAPHYAKTLMHRFRKATGIGGEIKGHRLTLQQRRQFFDGLARVGDALTVSTTCSRTDLVGGWAMGAMDEADLRTALIVESCAALPIAAGASVGITVDGGRYKKQVLDRLIPVATGALESHFAGTRFAMQYDGSERVPGLQVADIVANTLFHSMAEVATAEAAAELIRAAQATGRLLVRDAKLAGYRPAWLTAAP